MEGSVYLLHFDPPLGRVKHYTGFTQKDPLVRLAEHRAGGPGTGAKLTQRAVEAGCTLYLARVWENVPYAFERAIKKQTAARYCPLCSEEPQDFQL